MVMVAGGDDPFLLDWHLGDVDLHAQIAASHHHHVGLGDDLVKSLERFAFLDLCHDTGAGAARSQNVSQRTDLVGRTNEAQPYKVDTGLRGPDCVLMIGHANGRDAELDSWQIDSLPAADGASLDNAHPSPISVF